MGGGVAATGTGSTRGIATAAGSGGVGGGGGNGSGGTSMGTGGGAGGGVGTTVTGAGTGSAVTPAVVGLGGGVVVAAYLNGNAGGGRSTRGAASLNAPAPTPGRAVSNDQDIAFTTSCRRDLAPDEAVVLKEFTFPVPTLDPRLGPLAFTDIDVRVTSDYFVLERLAAEYFVQSPSSFLPRYEVAGLDVEFENLTAGKQIAALVQLGTIRTSYHALLAHIAHMRRIPSSFRRIIEEISIIKLTHHPHQDVRTLEELVDQTYPEGDPRRHMRCRSFLDIVDMAKLFWRVTGDIQLVQDAQSSRPGLDHLAKIFLGLELRQAPSSGTWADPDLTKSKQIYASLDIFATQMVFHSIVMRLERHLGDQQQARALIQEQIDKSMSQRYGGFDF
ncbi:hypothetical protein HDV00_001997 [Rhizophlyctis rosea]|nr:hypothetical protein HDV00_001997 [Rhizophlyctis rosea]